MKRADIIKRHIVYIFSICLFLLLLRLLNISCPILYLLGIPCPTCGVSRALLAFMIFDFKGYIHYHPLAVPLVSAVILMLHLKLIERKKLVYYFVFVVLVFNIILYFLRFSMLKDL